MGEIRDGAAYDLLQALNTGHGGSMSTVHADSAQGALQRFAALVLESGVQMPIPAIKANIAAALHYLVYIERRQAKRYVAEVLRMGGYDPDTGYGMLDIPAALTRAAPNPDSPEPNDDIRLVEPGGSRRDDTVVAAAQAAGVTLYFTGVRHFYH